MLPTLEEITAEISALEALSMRLPVARRNLAVVIATLTAQMTTDEVYDQFDTESNEFSYAFDAAMWMSGEGDKPSEGWE